MEDAEILELFLRRDDEALRQTQARYGALCARIAREVLHSAPDEEECLQDTWLALWNSIPPQRPQRLGAFACGVVRRLALKRYDYLHAQKRFSPCTQPYEELEACLPGEHGPQEKLDARRLGETLDAFLRTLPREQRQVFLLRYWFCMPVAQIVARQGCSQSRIKSMLLRTREKLRHTLEKEDWM